MGQKRISLVSKLIRDRETPISEVCDAVGVSRATLYRYLEPDGSPRRRTGQS
jgi:DNA-binding phage protein